MQQQQNFYRIFRESSLSVGRQSAKKHTWYFILFFLIILASSLIAQSFHPGVDSAGNEIVNGMSFFSDMLYIFFSSITTVIGLRIYLDLAQNKKFSFTHFNLTTRAKRRMIGKWIWGYIVYSLIVIGGIVLLVIPGVYFAIRLSLWEYYLIDKNMGPLEALRASWDKTVGHIGELIRVGIISFGIGVLGLLAVGIGLLWAIPTIKVASAHLYKKISEE